MDDAMTEVLKIVLEAKDEASSTLKEFTGHVDGIGGHIAAAAQATRVGLGMMGVAAAGVLVYSAKAAIDFESMTQKIANNTTMTVAQLGQMRQSILQLSASSGAPLDQLAEGFMHIQNLGFSAADSTTILKTAMESALSTGSNVADVANTLALQMHDFGLGAQDAAHAMDVLHLAAASGNATLEQFVESTSKAVTTAANLGVPLTQVDAALSALSRHMPLAQASTSLAGLMDKIVAPSISASKELARLSKVTGIDLVGDFSAAGLKAKGLTGILADLQAATGGNTTEIMKLIPATRGGLAAMVLLGTAAGDYKDILGKLNEAMIGKLTPTAKAFAAEQATTAAQMAKLTASTQVMAIEIGSVLIPIINEALTTIMPFVMQITAWIGKHPQLTAAILGTVAALGLLVGGASFLGMVLGPLAGIIGTLAAPLAVVALAAGALYLAWQTDFGGIREKTAALWSYLQPALQAIEHSIDLVRLAFAAGGLRAAAGVAWGQVQALTAQFVAWLGQQAPRVAAQLGQWATAFTAWVGPATTKFLAEWPGMLSQFLDWIGTAAGDIAGKLGTWSGKFLAWVAPMIPTFLRALALINAAILGFILETAVTLGVNLLKWGLKFTEWVLPRIGPLLGELGKLLDRLISWIKTDGASQIKAQLGIWANKFSDWVMSQGWPQLKTALGQMLTAFQNWILTTAGPQIKTDVATWVPKIQEAFGNAGTILYGVGTQIVQGLIDGIGSMFGAVQSKLADLTKLIPLHKGPPAVDVLLLHNSGQLIIQGLINGMDSKKPYLAAYLSSITALVARGIPSGFGGGAGGSAGTPPAATRMGGSSGGGGSFPGSSADRVGAWIGQQTIHISVSVGEGVSVLGGSARHQAGAAAIGEALRALLDASRATNTVAGTFLPGGI